MNHEFLRQDSTTVAKQLLGWYFVRIIKGERVVVKIVETESYDQNDMASHSYKGRTPRNDVMFGPAGHLYVYFTYGMHYCCNVVTGEEGEGQGVLIRAVEPVEGEAVLRAHRSASGINLTNGPAKLCQALSINRMMNGHDLTKEPLQLVPGEPVAESDIVTTTRIGIRQAVAEPRRFYISANPYVSKLS